MLYRIISELLSIVGSLLSYVERREGIKNNFDPSLNLIISPKLIKSEV